MLIRALMFALVLATAASAQLRPYDKTLAGQSLAGQDLSGLDLRGADLRGADLRNADLSMSDLTGANLEGANLAGAILTDTVLDGVVHDHTTRWPASLDRSQLEPFIRPRDPMRTVDQIPTAAPGDVDRPRGL